MPAELAVVDLPAVAADSPAATRFHLSLNVTNLGKSTEFFGTLFDREPAKRRSDYAKFELDDPPLVLSLEPAPAVTAGGGLNHVGFRLPSVAALVEMQQRLESRGISTQREEGVECCYARQTKFWLHDPDGNLWEVYTLDEDIEHRGMPAQVDASPAPPPDSAPSPAVWQHRIGQPLPRRIFVQDGSVDEARLQGTFNLPCGREERRRILAEVFRALRPGGKLKLHVLTADCSPADGNLDLPGAAAVVREVPVLSELIGELGQAGFASLHFEKLADTPCFQRLGAELRETRLDAARPAAAAGGAPLRVLYKGPGAQVQLDDCRTLRRGEFVQLDAATARALKESAPDDFVVAPLAAAAGCRPE